MIASIALLAWPVVSLVLYLTMPVGRATIWTLLGGYLLLPVIASFDLPGLPSFDKDSIPNLTVLILAPIMARRGEFRWPRSKTFNLLILLFVLVRIGTTITNRDAITIGSVVLPGLDWWETMSYSVSNALILAPFILGAAMLNTERGHRDLLKAFVLGALIYTLPVLAEIRLSPFLLNKIYGIYNDLFLQQIRYGGFRAMVFLGHGLLISAYFAMALMAAIGLWRMKIRMFSLPMALIAALFVLVLILNKTIGPIVLLALFVPLFLVLNSRKYLTIVLGVAMLIIAYPFLRGTDLAPVRSFSEAIRPLSPERADSFKFRLDNEDLLLSRASIKPWFGWGRFGRSRVIILTDWGETRDITTTDGAWVIAIGISGWAGYIATFGLLTYPFLRAFRLRRLPLPIASVTLLTLLLLNVVDLIPNSSLRPITWLIAGALAGMTAASLRKGTESRAARRPSAPDEAHALPA